MKLTDRYDNEIEYKGNKFFMNLAFDIVLRAYELKSDPNFNNYQRVSIMWEMFIVNHDEHDVTFEDKNTIVKTIFDHFLEPEKDKEINDDNKTQGQGKPLFDFEHDAEYIYASFLQDYKIDLFEMQGVLRWEKFLALLSSLKDDTKFKEVIGIRGQKIPPPTKFNKDERDRIIKLKQIYALPVASEEVIQSNMNNVLSSLSATFKGGR
ncbi:hypothetical protein CHH83_20910 [Bacillus sp. 7586-K]|nr:hypothetical protein CHH83_20910 [Bacillus sp. 7586-K]